jgi:halimadienyl-diphosphate synthase
LDYLRSVTNNGAVPYTSPIDVFEIAWSYWNLILAGYKVSLKDRSQVKFLQENWQINLGAAPDSGLSLVDGDTTSMVFSVLTQLGQPPDLPTLLTYELKDHFRCYWLESNFSISTNIHALGALHELHCSDHPAVHKILKFLHRTQTPEGCWFDKWHVSPYYTTAHAIISCQELDPELVEKAGKWLLTTQMHSGAWGVYSQMPTAEETAYALQALVIWRRMGGNVPKTVLQRGVAWLQDHISEQYPLLWIGKVLYCPEVIVRTTIHCALDMARQEI